LDQIPWLEQTPQNQIPLPPSDHPLPSYLGQVPSILLREVQPRGEPRGEDMQIKFVKIGLFLPPEKLKIDINQRTLAKTVGMIKEATNLHKKGLSWKKMQEFGLEYRCLALYLQKKITRPEMIEKINSETYKYAKRQMTWFKRDPEIQWFDTSEYNFLEISNLIKKWGFYTKFSKSGKIMLLNTKGSI
jgi:tRNA A37 N6-isopentenylltransferase MiaA